MFIEKSKIKIISYIVWKYLFFKKVEHFLLYLINLIN
jgi:hypothetical protein